MGEASTPEECLKGMSKETGRSKWRRSLGQVQIQCETIWNMLCKRERKEAIRQEESKNTSQS